MKSSRPAPYNLRPCQLDPVCRLLQDQLRLSPLTAAAVFVVIYLAGNFLASCLAGTAFPRPGLDMSFVEDRVAWVLYLFALPAGAFLALRFYHQIGTTFERLHWMEMPWSR